MGDIESILTEIRYMRDDIKDIKDDLKDYMKEGNDINGKQNERLVALETAEAGRKDMVSGINKRLNYAMIGIVVLVLVNLAINLINGGY